MTRAEAIDYFYGLSLNLCGEMCVGSCDPCRADDKEAFEAIGIPWAEVVSE
jgi:hypothetical protein